MQTRIALSDSWRVLAFVARLIARLLWGTNVGVWCCSLLSTASRLRAHLAAWGMTLQQQRR